MSVERGMAVLCIKRSTRPRPNAVEKDVPILFKREFIADGINFMQNLIRKVYSIS